MISLKNNAQSVLAMSVDTHQTQLNLSLGDGVKFPDLSLGDHFRCCLKDAAGNLEFVKVTQRAGDVLTVLRGQEGTPARAWNAGTRIQLRMTAKMWDEMAGEHWQRLVDASGNFVVPQTSGAASFTLSGDWREVFEPTRSFRLYQTGGTFQYGYVKSITFSGGVTTVVADDGLVPANAVAVDIGLPLNVHPKSINSTPVAHMVAPDAHASLFAARELAVHRGNTAPPDGARLWLNTNDGTLNYHNGSAWVAVVGRYADA